MRCCMRCELGVTALPHPPHLPTKSCLPFTIFGFVRNSLLSVFPGNNWVMKMMSLLIREDRKSRGLDPGTQSALAQFPFLEIQAKGGPLVTEKFQTVYTEHPIYMKTHLPIEKCRGHLEKHPNLRVVHVLRNPKDTMVSMFHHLVNDTNLGGFTGTWDQFFEELVKKKRLPWGDFFDHTVGWYEFNKGRENSLILTYEEMKKDHSGNVVKLSNFLGYNLSDQAIEAVVEQSSFGSMHKEYKEMWTNVQSWKQGSSLVRKGEVGDWVNYFSEEQSRWIEDRCKKDLEPLGITFQYSI